MTFVFYCYGVRLGQGEPPFADNVGLMFFSTPPAKGDAVSLQGVEPLGVIQRIDHYHMIIDVSLVEDGQCVPH